MESKSGCYKTMDLAVREEISLGLAKGLDQAQIARLVGFAPRHPPQRPITPSAGPCPNGTQQPQQPPLL
jgi:hypothetical protein